MAQNLTRSESFNSTKFQPWLKPASDARSANAGNTRQDLARHRAVRVVTPHHSAAHDHLLQFHGGNHRPESIDGAAGRTSCARYNYSLRQEPHYCIEWNIKYFRTNTNYRE